MKGESFYFNNKEVFLLNLSDTTSGIEVYREYTCLVTSFSESSEYGEIICDTSPFQTLKKEIVKFNGLVSIDDRVVTFNMNNPRKTPIINKENSFQILIILVKKNSSGLSGGVSAGIVIVYAVVLIAASFVFMKLKKQKPPLDNTTVIGLKKVDNYKKRKFI